MNTSPGEPADLPLPGDAVGDDLQPLHASLAQDLRDGVEESDRADVAAREESVRRRLADRRLVDQLAREEFSGPLYEAFITELTRYGLSVMKAWIRSGEISRLMRKRGAGNGLSEAERARMLRERDLADDLAHMTVAQALRNFQKSALRGGRWRGDGGAQLTTYFMGACLYAFADELKRMRSEMSRRSGEIIGDGIAYDLHEFAATDDPERGAVLGELAAAAAGQLKPKERVIVRLMALGYEYEEIAEMTDATVRAVEGSVYRMRRRLERETSMEGARHGI